MRKLLRRCAALLNRGKLRAQLEEEMAAHREMMPTDRRRNFGSTLRLQEQIADQWGLTWLDQLRQDLRYGARSLLRSPGFTLTAVAVLSVGIGVNLAEVHVFNAFLHRLNVRDVDSLCRFFRVTHNRTESTFSLPEIDFYRRHNTVLTAVIAELTVPGVYYSGDPVDLRCVLVSGNFFEDLGTTPLYGRLLSERDDQPGAAPVAVLGYDYWRNHFGSDPRIVNQVVRLNDKPVQVVGIVPADFGGLIQQNTNMWLSTAQYSYLTGDRSLLSDFEARRAIMTGRLKPGVSMQSADDHFRVLAAELHRAQPQAVTEGEWLKAEPPEAPPNSTPAGTLLLGTCILLVLMVLFSACANLGNMLLARGMARRREIEIRLAIGAGRWRLVRQLMTENLLLAAIGSVSAILVGRMAARLLLKLTGAPSHLRILTDWRIVLVAAGLGLAATLAFGLAPALQIARQGRSATTARKVLVLVQVAASCVLLILSSFLTRSVAKTIRSETAFDVSKLVLVDPSLYLNHDTLAQNAELAREMAARLRQVPGVEAAAILAYPPLRRGQVQRVNGQQLYVNHVDPSYFAMMRLALLQGRVFGAAEPDAAVISESAARHLWPGRQALGQSLLVGIHPRTVTGVVRDSGVNLLQFPDSVEVYTPFQEADAFLATFFVRTASAPAPLSGTLRSAVSHPGLSPQVFTVQGLVNQRLDSITKMVRVVGSLAGIASLMAMLGIFGLLAFTVAQRTREIGVRMALGARRNDVLVCVVGQFVVPFGAGVAGGTVLAFAAAKVAQYSLRIPALRRERLRHRLAGLCGRRGNRLRGAGPAGAADRPRLSATARMREAASKPGDVQPGYHLEVAYIGRSHAVAQFQGARSDQQIR